MPAEAREKYLRLHLNPELQAVALAKHYLEMAKLAQPFQDLVDEWQAVRGRPRKHKGKSVAQSHAEEQIEKVVDYIKLKHLEDFGIPLIWNRTITNTPQ